jgi:hypothetical protein
VQGNSNADFLNRLGEYTYSLLTDPGFVVGFAGVIIGIAGIAVALWTHKRGTRIKAPLWDTRIANLVQGGGRRLADLKIVYKGEERDTVSTSTFVFWNAGQETILQTDIVRADPPRIEAVGDTLLLDATCLVANEASNKLDVERPVNNKRANITFDYLDQGNGGVFQAVHTGTQWTDAVITGRVKGVGPIQKKTRQPSWTWFCRSLPPYRLIGR